MIGFIFAALLFNLAKCYKLICNISASQLHSVSLSIFIFMRFMSFQLTTVHNHSVRNTERDGEEKRWKDNEPVSATAIGNQERTLWIIKAWQAQERERVREEEKEAALDYAPVSNPISSVHGVCECVRVISSAWLPLRAVKSNLKSKPKCICVCVYHTMANLLSLRPSIHLNDFLWFRVFLCLAMHFWGFILCPCVLHIDAFPLKWLSLYTVNHCKLHWKQLLCRARKCT